MIKRLALLVFMLLVSVPVFAETVDTAWVRRYNGPGDGEDEASAIAVDGSGNVYVTGFSSGGYDTTGLLTYEDFATIKYYPNGDTAWVRRYNGPGYGSDGASSIAVDDSGNVYVTGFSLGGYDTAGALTYQDFATIKYYPNGDTAWLRRYNGPANWYDEATAIAVDNSGNVYVTGRSWGNGTSEDFCTIKYDSSGNELWVKRYAGVTMGDDGANAMTLDGSGNLYVTGDSYGSGTGADYATIKYYPNGDTAWVRRYNGPGNWTDWASAITVDRYCNVYVTGRSDQIKGNPDYCTIKYDSSGNQLWVVNYNGTGNYGDIAEAIAVDSLGNVYVTGTSPESSSYPYNYHYITIKYYPNGDTVWVRRYNGSGNGNDRAYALAIDGSGNVYVTGTSGTIKYGADGSQLWFEQLGGFDIAVDGSDNIYVTGTDFGYVTIKYIQKRDDVADEPEEKEKPCEFALSQNYPNPFNPATLIPFTVHGEQKTVNSPIRTTLTIYNILGQKVRTLVDEDKVPGEYQVVWDGKDDSGKKVGSGIYFYRLKVGDFSEAKRSVLLK